MFRPSLFRPTTLSRTVLLARSRRTATTHAPTNASGPVTGEIGRALAPGEEIDPQLNGYPQLPYVSLQHREPFGWWDQQERKNFGEVVHEEEDALGMWGPDAHKMSGLTALGALVAAFSAIGVFALFLNATRLQSPVAKRSYPYAGLESELGGRNAARVEEEAMDDE